MNLLRRMNNNVSVLSQQMPGQMYLYGEVHGAEKILDKELELWCEYYHNNGMRHLFVELPYYTAEFFNLWMQSHDDVILDELHNDSKGTAVYITAVKTFYKAIKEQCPETIFHGTDIGHQYCTTGERFLKYLEDNDLEDSRQYQLTLEAIEQGNRFYAATDWLYRENTMTENFIRELNTLTNESIMGIYGAAHTNLNDLAYGTQSVPRMANQLKKDYGDRLYIEDLSQLAKDIYPLSVDTLQVNGKTYVASYFGEEHLTGFKDYASRKFWRLEDAYDDFKERSNFDMFPYGNYSMSIETGQILVIEYTKIDGSTFRGYHRSDGDRWQGELITTAFKVD